MLGGDPFQVAWVLHNWGLTFKYFFLQIIDLNPPICKTKYWFKKRESLNFDLNLCLHSERHHHFMYNTKHAIVVQDDQQIQTNSIPIFLKTFRAHTNILCTSKWIFHTHQVVIHVPPPPNPIMLTIKPIMVDTFWAWHPISYKNTYLLNVRSHKHIKPHITRVCVLIIVVLDIGMSTLSPCTLGVFKPICFWICRPRTRRHHVDSLLDQFIHEFTCSRSCNNDLSCLSSPHTQGTQWGPIKSTDRISDYFVCFLSS